MKRVLLLTFAPLAGCSAGRTCNSTPVYQYVDTTQFDDGGYRDQACNVACPERGNCLANPFDLGVAQVNCNPDPCTGRRPAELVRAGARGDAIVGRWLAEAAELEAASVPAFEILADELRAHDAPPPLVARALASADDERRHAATMARLARRWGASPGPVRVVRRAPRELEAIARENAVEGLVREAYGALVAFDPVIAADEARHAALAADVHAWLRPRLPLPARRRVDEAHAAARAALVADCAVEPPPALRALRLVPDATRAVDLARRV